jgi:DNA polymerase-3 subunit beta
MSDPLLTIGAFARAVGLTASALRHYDECGLLRPVEVDDVTGYRYYTPELAERARLVAKMREAGLSIAAMRIVLDGPPDEARAVLERVVEEQAVRSARTTAVLEDVLSDLAAPGGAEATTRVDVHGPELAAALRQVLAAADGDAASPLGSVLVDVVPGSIDVVATNRYWMAIRTIPVEQAVDEARVVLSQPAALELAAHLDACAMATVSLSEHRVCVGDLEVKGRTEPYPAHRIVVGGLEPAVTRAVLPRAELAEAVEATGRAETRVALTSSGMQVGDGASERSRTLRATVTGPAMTVGLGSALVLRALSATLGPEVQWQLSAPDRPIRMTSPYQRGYLALVMPLGAP